ncbi:venom acid phosphatase Acph-1-like [Tenebrio molitor]|uniref:venom acid phosphatase Acph-1-like n=1 Tax=Tenebrio molitor TaxID=7067 RepID=UPI003624737F
MNAYRNYLIFFAILIVLQRASFDNNASTLQLVHILFRHGDRTTELNTVYPKDPYKNETYYPYGYGELTNKGKMREFTLGKFLRQRYDNFLGKIYTPDLLEGLSSDVNRTKMSLQLVLAGMLPPVDEQIWETGLNWQPIPFNVVPSDQDTIFSGTSCSNYQKHLSELTASPKVVQELEQHKTIFEYLSKQSGLDVKTYGESLLLYECLWSEQEYGLTLPDWTKNVYPEPLRDLALKSYSLGTDTTQLRKLTSGSLLKRIIDNSKGKSSGELVPENRKLFLYSGHDINIGHMLITLDVFEPHFPPYGSYILFELHFINDVEGFKIYYQNYSSAEPKLLKLPSCDEFCPLSDFTRLLDQYIPEDDACGVIE